MVSLWHCCDRWHDKGLPCPFHRPEEGFREREDGDREKDFSKQRVIPDKVPIKVGDRTEKLVDEPLIDGTAGVPLPAEAKVPVQVWCNCPQGSGVMEMVKAAKVMFSRQGPLIHAIGQPPPPPFRTGPQPPVVRDRTIGRVGAAVRTRALNLDDQLRAMAEAEIAETMAIAVNNRVTNVVSVKVAVDAWGQQVGEIGMTGQEAVRAIAGGAIEGALPYAKSVIEQMQRGEPVTTRRATSTRTIRQASRPGIKPPGVGGPRTVIPPRVIQTIIGGNRWTGGGVGFTTKSHVSGLEAPITVAPQLTLMPDMKNWLFSQNVGGQDVD